MYEQGTYHSAIVRFGSGKQDNQKATEYFFVEVTPNHFWSAEGKWERIVEQGNRTIKLFLSDAAFEYSYDKLEKFLGFNGDFGSPAIDAAIQARGVAVVCKHEPYTDKNGQTKTAEKWDFPGGGTINHSSLPNEVVRKLNAKWQEERRSKVGPRTPQSASQTNLRPPLPPNPTDNTEDDPFGQVANPGDDRGAPY